MRDSERVAGSYKGSCNCGDVSYSVNGSLSSVVACHCGQCRKQTGLYYAAADCPDGELTVEDQASLKWYAASDTAKRGFCSNCGSALFWKANDSKTTSILVGTLDGDVPMKIDRHIFCADKGDFYDITDGLPQFPQED